MKTTISATIDVDLKKRCEDYKISISRALEFGVQFLIAEIERDGYPDNSLSFKIIKLQEVIKNLSEGCPEAEKQ